MIQLSLSNLENIAGLFTTNTGSDRSRLHARPGLLVATDGRYLIHIEHRFVEAIPNSNENFLNFEPEAGKLIAGREWIESTLRKTVQLADADDAIRFRKEQTEFLRELENNATTCPCCGSRLVVCYGNELDEYDSYRENNAPDRMSASSATGLHFSKPPKNMFFGTRRLAIALHAAAELGGADELLCSKNQLILKGDGFWIVLMCLRDGGSNVYTVNVPDTGKDGAA